MMLSTPTAQADDASFVRGAKALGFTQAAVNLVSTADSACYFLGPRHRDPDEVQNRIARYHVVDQNQAHQFLVLAVNEYCPQLAGLVGG